MWKTEGPYVGCRERSVERKRSCRRRPGVWVCGAGVEREQIRPEIRIPCSTVAACAVQGILDSSEGPIAPLRCCTGCRACHAGP